MTMISLVFSGAESCGRVGRAEIAWPESACRALSPLQNCPKPPANLTAADFRAMPARLWLMDKLSRHDILSQA